jgi:copper chaperone CopZ
MNEHKPKRVAVMVLLAGGALAAVAMRQNTATEQRERSLPVLEEIPSYLAVSAGEGEVVRAYSVSGMCCASCTRKLHQRIASMDGVEACAVDLAQERLTLIARNNLPPERILMRLSFGKYTAVELP